jgi:isoleucyl-tRNA synthetase
MLRWMAPFLSFTAEEAWKLVGTGQPGDSIFTQVYSDLGTPDDGLLAKWTRIREIRDHVNVAIEQERKEGRVGSSLQANLNLQVTEDDFSLLQSLGDDAKFVFIVSKVNVFKATGVSDDVKPGEAVFAVTPSTDTKCERCWHYRADVGHDPAYPTICGRCTTNLYGAGEARSVA